jgi:hypothetical protein
MELIVVKCLKKVVVDASETRRFSDSLVGYMEDVSSQRFQVFSMPGRPVIVALFREIVTPPYVRTWTNLSKKLKSEVTERKYRRRDQLATLRTLVTQRSENSVRSYRHR